MGGSDGPITIDCSGKSINEIVDAMLNAFDSSFTDGEVEGTSEQVHVRLINADRSSERNRLSDILFLKEFRNLQTMKRQHKQAQSLLYAFRNKGRFMRYVQPLPIPPQFKVDLTLEKVAHMQQWDELYCALFEEQEENKSAEILAQQQRRKEREEEKERLQIEKERREEEILFNDWKEALKTPFLYKLEGHDEVYPTFLHCRMKLVMLKVGSNLLQDMLGELSKPHTDTMDSKIQFSKDNGRTWSKFLPEIDRTDNDKNTLLFPYSVNKKFGKKAFPAGQWKRKQNCAYVLLGKRNGKYMKIYVGGTGNTLKNRINAGSKPHKKNHFRDLDIVLPHRLMIVGNEFADGHGWPCFHIIEGWLSRTIEDAITRLGISTDGLITLWADRGQVLFQNLGNVCDICTSIAEFHGFDWTPQGGLANPFSDFDSSTA